jgi:hypothetical protein
MPLRAIFRNRAEVYPSALRALRQCLGVVLSICLATPYAAAQQAPSRSAQVDLGSITGRLQIFVLKGRDEIHLASDQTQKFIVVEIRDDNNLPVEGAEVSFELPASGPGGSFRGGLSKTTTRSTGQGQAAAAFNPNQQLGKFQISVKASIGERSGSINVNQRISDSLNALSAGKKRGFFNKKSIVILSIVGAGAATAAILATRNGNSGSGAASTSPVTITPGSPTFGGPR